MMEALFYSSALIVFGGVIVFLFTRRPWKARVAELPARSVDSNERLERLENGMETIALEIERISEGQRFVTRLLSESALPAPPSITQSVRAQRPPNR